MFCPKCGSLLIPKKSGKKKVLKCKCGYTKQEKLEDLKFTESIQHKEIEVVETDFEAHPLMDVKCPKCKHDKAFYWTVQTRASDEPPTKFMKCESCKHIWRDYS